MDALYSEGEIQGGIQRKVAKQKRIMDTVDKIMQVLKSENWGVYYKNQPISPLEIKDGDSLYKVNRVDEADIEETLIKALTEGKSWKSSQTISDQNKNSTSG